ncbi:MAG TPA: hypothetical protein VLG50_07605 [Candidatus Saccharimonadales bacterium]|nr:hypothetical protein [Candidatus Saccharimonadales bacterium]
MKISNFKSQLFTKLWLIKCMTCDGDVNDSISKLLIYLTLNRNPNYVPTMDDIKKVYPYYKYCENENGIVYELTYCKKEYSNVKLISHFTHNRFIEYSFNNILIYLYINLELSVLNKLPSVLDRNWFI